MIQEIDERLEKRLGRLHARLRLGIEADHEAQVFGQGINYFHIENLLPSRACLKLTGLYGRGHKNAAQIELRRHDVISSRIPNAFDGFTILQLSDLHVDMSEAAMTRLAVMLPDINYDLCVLSGDYRARTIGAYEPALAGMARLCSGLKRPIYGVLGARTGGHGHPNAVAAFSILSTRPFGNFSILLSHTPEVYQQASYADFGLLLCGHTHGGQICLPGRIPITLDSVLPRYMGSGPWKYHDMIGYTSVGAGSSVVPVRFNCPPEITLHRLCRPGSAGSIGTIANVPLEKQSRKKYFAHEEDDHD